MDILGIALYVVAIITFLVMRKNLKLLCKDLEAEKDQALQALINKESQYSKLLSQKKSSETRLGQISENLVPFLSGCKHDPKNMHFLGNPIDYVAFDFDEATITFIEVKSGNSRESKRQKTIKNIIKNCRVYYEEIRINEAGVNTKESENVE